MAFITDERWIKFNIFIFSFYCVFATVSFSWPELIDGSQKEKTVLYIVYIFNLFINIYIVHGLMKRKTIAYYLIAITSIPAIIQLLWFLIPFGLDAAMILPTRSFYSLIILPAMRWEKFGFINIFLVYIFNIFMIAVNIKNFRFFLKLSRK